EEELRRRSAALPPTGIAPLGGNAPATEPPPKVETPPPPVEPAPVAVATTPDDAPKDTPVYRRWWLWAAVAAVVGVAVGVGLGVGLSGAKVPDHAGDTAGSALVRF